MMDRRSALKLTAAGLGGLLLGTEGPLELRASARAPAVGRRRPDVVVVGAGAFGGWTALHLARRGASVTLVDAYGPGNSRSSSGGETRLIRLAYGDRTLYTRMAMESYPQWRALEDESGSPIVLSTGRLVMSSEPGARAEAEAYVSMMNGLGVGGTEILGPDEISYRWPQIRSDDLELGIFDPGGAAASTLMARRSCRVVGDRVREGGGEIRIAEARPGSIRAGRLTGVQMGNGEDLQADQYVFACGPWLRNLFPELMAERLRIERRDVLFVGSPSGDPSYSYPHLPAWSVRGTGWYGFPDIEHRGLKAAPYPDLNPLDPDLDQRMVTPQQVKRVQEFAAHRFPGLAAQPVTETRVCQVTNTADAHLIVDRHPELENTWIVGGGSGHGFKHGPRVGELTAALVTGDEVDEEYRQTFRQDWH